MRGTEEEPLHCRHIMTMVASLMHVTSTSLLFTLIHLNLAGLQAYQEDFRIMKASVPHHVPDPLPPRWGWVPM